MMIRDKQIFEIQGNVGKKKKGQEDALDSGRNLPTVRELSEIIFLTMDHSCQITKEIKTQCFIIYLLKKFFPSS
jgi:hypothetical protein